MSLRCYPMQTIRARIRALPQFRPNTSKAERKNETLVSCLQPDEKPPRLKTPSFQPLPRSNLTISLRPTQVRNMATTAGSPEVPRLTVPSWESSTVADIFRPYMRARMFDKDMRQRPDVWDICSGCILWLPSRSEIDEKLIPGSGMFNQEPSFFDRPVLILAVNLTNPTTGTLRFVPMISLGYKAPLHIQHANSCLPIAPNVPHPHSKVLLRLENRNMTEKCHVYLRDGYFDLDWTAFRCYAKGDSPPDGFRYRLRKESFKIVTEELGIQEPPWIDTSSIWNSFIRTHKLWKGMLVTKPLALQGKILFPYIYKVRTPATEQVAYPQKKVFPRTTPKVGRQTARSVAYRTRKAFPRIRKVRLQAIDRRDVSEWESHVSSK